MLFIMLKHSVRTLLNPYYVAMAKTLSELVYHVIDKGGSAERNELAFVRALAGLDFALQSFLRNGPEPFRLGIEHWASRLASPVSVRTISTILDDKQILRRVLASMEERVPTGGMGLAAFQDELKRLGHFESMTMNEALQRLGG